MALYLKKRFGIVRGTMFRIAVALGAFGGLLSFRDFESAKTTDVSIWRSGMFQYRLRRRSFSAGLTI